MIKNFKPRLYQETIFNTCSLNNTLVVLPTGLGKTNIFLMVTANRLSLYPKSKILLLGPTRPLIEQYYNNFIENFEIRKEDISIITGMIKPEKRKDIYNSSKIIFSTPQCIENDIITDSINLKDFSLIGFDEAHRAVGDYAYNFIAKKYVENSNKSRIVAMTASPGDTKEKVNEVMNNLFIESIEVRTEDDNDVKPYIQETKVKTIEVHLPDDFKEIKKLIESIIKERFKFLKEIGITDSSEMKGKKDLLLLQREIQSRISSGEKDFELMKGMSVLAEIIKLGHGIELLESQGIKQLHLYMKKIFNDARTTKTKAVINISSNPFFKEAFIRVENLIDKNINHPKMLELEKLLLENPDGKKIIFTQFRDTANVIKESLDKSGLVTNEIFVGQAKKNGQGISQKQQKELIERFRNDEFEVLIATSVAEEGLDIPKVDKVIFFEPIPSAIRQIQRRGRTGRLEEGSVVVLLSKGTRDEGYKWSAYHKENRMYRILKEMQKTKKIDKIPSKNLSLKDFTEKKEEDNIKIIVDHREKANKIIRLLIDRGVKIKLETLEIGDYLLSDRVCVEFKTIPDFVDSIIDGRIMGQLKELKKYEKPLVIVEGTEDIYSMRNISPNAIKGVILASMISFGIPIYFSKDNIESSEILRMIATKEQLNEKRSFTLHNVKPNNDRELQEYIVSSFPGVGSTLSKPLLKRFRSIRNIANSKEDELKEIELIGEKKAKKIREILDKEYKDYE
ncbi:hypothetical protein C0585_00545 [Candidatus Woesearchaeota archaeon]|nr:MAG: hypothetical protein C0585_00545 [Candidatus Woesearchaeota archaeon]